MKELEKNWYQIFGMECSGLASKVEFQERIMPHHYIVVWPKRGVIEELFVIDQLISAELLLLGEKEVFCGLIRSTNRQWNISNCRNRAQHVPARDSHQKR